MNPPSKIFFQRLLLERQSTICPHAVEKLPSKSLPQKEILKLEKTL